MNERVGWHEAGEAVYFLGRPMRPGVVLRAIFNQTIWGADHYDAEVKWMNGKTEVVNGLHLKSFDTLIAEHKRKYEMFQEMRKKMLMEAPKTKTGRKDP